MRTWDQHFRSDRESQSHLERASWSLELREESGQAPRQKGPEVAWGPHVSPHPRPREPAGAWGTCSPTAGVVFARLPGQRGQDVPWGASCACLEGCVRRPGLNSQGAGTLGSLSPEGLAVLGWVRWARGRQSTLIMVPWNPNQRARRRAGGGGRAEPHPEGPPPTGAEEAARWTVFPPGRRCASLIFLGEGN